MQKEIAGWIILIAMAWTVGLVLIAGTCEMCRLFLPRSKDRVSGQH
ncbi:MAG: hypothetical protein HPY55_06615 [Firmicutes bacterium]|nr:hypothetical protein [Bacillota bacterium]